MVKNVVRYQTQKAIKKGIIKVPIICDECGEDEKLDCHHNDYNDPLDVSFLCTPCHYKKHRRSGINWVSMPLATCGKCNYEWHPRVESPVSCPRCKRSDWK